ncbi:hypothetical protein XHV734_1970 [Xanthomonas hortorum pv. vitians]|nr:hypothetical protein XHV734_1970 [Xanthomonas hortorum pv. vitians]
MRAAGHGVFDVPAGKRRRAQTQRRRRAPRCGRRRDRDAVVSAALHLPATAKQVCARHSGMRHPHA